MTVDPKPQDNEKQIHNPLSVPVVTVHQIGAILRKDGANCITSLDNDDPAQRALMVTALLDSDYKAADHDGQDYPVEHVLMQYRELEDKDTGELKMIPTLAMISPTGEVLTSCSEYLPASLRTLVMHYGPPPWRPPLHLIIVHRPTSNGRTMHRFRCLGQYAVEPSKPG